MMKSHFILFILPSHGATRLGSKALVHEPLGSTLVHEPLGSTPDPSYITRRHHSETPLPRNPAIIVMKEDPALNFCQR